MGGFFMIELYFLIPAVIAQLFNPTAELVMSTAMASNEVNSEIETHPLIAETKPRKCSK